MPYITKKVKNLNLNYDISKIEPIELNGIFQLPSTHNIEYISLLLNSKTIEFVEPVTTYLIHRHLTGKENSDFEVRGLRLYFDFLEVINKSWLDGSDEVFNRPISLFSKYLKSSFEKGEIAGTVAIGYFNIVWVFGLIG